MAPCMLALLKQHVTQVGHVLFQPHPHLLVLPSSECGICWWPFLAQHLHVPVGVQQPNISIILTKIKACQQPALQPVLS